MAGAPDLAQLDEKENAMTRDISDSEAERHRQKMVNRKTVQDAEVAEKTIEKVC